MAGVKTSDVLCPSGDRPAVNGPILFGIPMGPELIVLFLILIPLAVVGAALVLLFVLLGRRQGSDRVEALEERIEELEAQVDQTE